MPVVSVSVMVKVSHVVEVDSAPLLGELSAYYREEIMNSLRQSEGFPNLQDIRFRAGNFETNT